MDEVAMAMDSLVITEVFRHPKITEAQRLRLQRVAVVMAEGVDIDLVTTAEEIIDHLEIKYGLKQLH